VVFSFIFDSLALSKEKLFLLKLKWPKNNNIYDVFLAFFS